MSTASPITRPLIPEPVLPLDQEGPPSPSLSRTAALVSSTDPSVDSIASAALIVDVKDVESETFEEPAAEPNPCQACKRLGNAILEALLFIPKTTWSILQWCVRRAPAEPTSRTPSLEPLRDDDLLLIVRAHFALHRIRSSKNNDPTQAELIIASFLKYMIQAREHRLTHDGIAFQREDVICAAVTDFKNATRLRINAPRIPSCVLKVAQENIKQDGGDLSTAVARLAQAREMKELVTKWISDDLV